MKPEAKLGATPGAKLWTQCLGVILLMSASATAAFGLQHNLRFVDQAGTPIADVVVRATYTATPPAIGGGPIELKSDADGRLTVSHPCALASGSCCSLVSPVSYQVIGKLGYQFNGSGSVGCGLGSSDFTFIGTGQEYPKLAVVSAANFRAPLASQMIVAAFGLNLATTTEIAANIPLPTTLANRRVLFRNLDGMETAAPLLFVSPNQINFLVPAQGVNRLPTIIVRDLNNQIVSVTFPTIELVAPGIFTANADGQGVPAAVIVRARADGSQAYEPVAQFDQTARRYVPVTLDLGVESDVIVLALFGTGWRTPPPATTVAVKIAGIECPVEYAGPQPTSEGLDQLNVRLPRALIGKGDVIVEVQFNSTKANSVQLKIK